MTRDPRIERAAIELAYLEAPSLFFPRLDQIGFADKVAWWRAMPEANRDGYLLKAETAIEAYENTEAFDAAAE